MATEHYTNLIEQLKSIPRGNSEGANQKGKNQAIQHVNNSDLPDSEKKTVISAIRKSANPSGWYTTNNGTNAAISELHSMISESGTLLLEKDNNQIQSQKAVNMAPKQTFNRRNLKNLVSDGKIFSVEFIKRSTGELRTMTARLGVRKHLQGGSKAYNPAHHNLLTVFDMDKRGYRTIPVEAIQRLSVGGQTFDFAGV